MDNDDFSVPGDVGVEFQGRDLKVQGFPEGGQDVARRAEGLPSPVGLQVKGALCLGEKGRQGDECEDKEDWFHFPSKSLLLFLVTGCLAQCLEDIIVTAAGD